MVTQEEIESRTFELLEENKVACRVTDAEMRQFDTKHQLVIKLMNLKVAFDNIHNYKTTMGYERFAEACMLGTSTIKRMFSGTIRITRTMLYRITVGMKMSLDEANSYFALCGGELREECIEDYICIHALLDGDDIHLFLEQFEKYTNYILERKQTEMPERPGQKVGQKKG